MDGTQAAENEVMHCALCPSVGASSYSAYRGQIAVSNDHLIVAQRVTQNSADNDSLQPMLDQIRLRCGAPQRRLPTLGRKAVAEPPFGVLKSKIIMRPC